MKSNELRIGNWVDWFGTFIQVSMTDFIRQEFKDNQDIFEHFKEIPLTEEWLLKFGFESDFYSGTKFYQLRYIKIFFKKHGFDLKIDNFHYGFIESVHQLQNLYFALTGEELQCKEI